MSYIRFENIVKSFGSNTVLKDINLEVEKGQLVTLLGPSGCGKTTLLKIIGMLNEPSKGTVLYKGKNIQGGYKNEENSAGRYGSRNRKPFWRRYQAAGAGRTQRRDHHGLFHP